ncbi:hypothetical protein INT45_006360 [Circinella minor]|uniref:Protein kinase domain-containing protein n=1 Tax=Circinella minor TaxID=1195481 RepID=A0A8H7SEF0_9FUNG|nr:hypothetical protein INT45_006360 [Circinella minor]
MYNESLDHHFTTTEKYFSSPRIKEGLPNELHIDTQSLHHSQPYTPTTGRDEYFSLSEMEQPMPVPLPNQRASGLITADGNRITDTPDTVPSLTSSTTTGLSPDMNDHHDVLPGSAPLMMSRSHSVKHHHHHSKHPLGQHPSHTIIHHPVRKCQSLANSPRVSSQSWGHMKSPAASFLSRFGMPDHLTSKNENEEGEEIDDYVFEKIIGLGGFSTVRRGYCISSGKKVAIKIYEKTEENKRLERELAIWKRLEHHHVLPLHKIVETESNMYAICDYCPGGTLLDLLRKKKDDQQPCRYGLNEYEAKKLFIQLCLAIQYLHDEARVCHKDIKLENVLLDENNDIKLCDFGLTMYCQLKTTTMHDDVNTRSMENEVAGGSLAYSAPEQVLSRKPVASSMSDMWSLGVLLYTLVVGQLPFQDTYDPRLQQKIICGCYELPSSIQLSNDLCLLLSNLLEVNPSKRYTIDQVLKSTWCSS